MTSTLHKASKSIEKTSDFYLLHMHFCERKTLNALQRMETPRQQRRVLRCPEGRLAVKKGERKKGGALSSPLTL